MRLALALAVLILAGCAPPIAREGERPTLWQRLNADPERADWWRVEHADWNPKQGVEWAIADCNAKAAASSGYDWIDAALRKAETRDNCMKAYGYTRR